MFGLEEWETAGSLYSEASSLQPNESYPKDQLQIVNAQLDEIAAREARAAAGEVEVITSRTGRFYVIVSSSIDQDLAMDYAQKLAREGNVVKIIEHDARDHLYYRVAVEDYGTREEAEAAAPSMGNYGDGVWVLSY